MIGLQIFTIYNYQFTIIFKPFTLYPHPHSSVGQASPCTNQDGEWRRMGENERGWERVEVESK
jgi:hypothetical protein